MANQNDLSRSLVAFEQDNTIIAVIEMSLNSWLVAGIVPGIERRPLKKLSCDEQMLLQLLYRWRDEAVKAGGMITRMVVAFEAGRDGFWLARWLRARGIEAYVIHPTSVAVSREHRRAKTDRLDTELLKRAFLGWLRGEPDHCSMAAIPSLQEEDAKRPTRERENLVGERTRIVNRMKACLIRFGIRNFNPTLRRATERLNALCTPEGVSLPPNTLAELRRDMARLRFVMDQINEIEAARLRRLEQAPAEEPHAKVRLLARVIGVGLETADMLVHEILSRKLRDRRAVARYAGLTGAPDESGSKRREKGLAKAGNARVRRGMIQLAWRFLLFQKNSALSQWYRARTESAGKKRKTVIVAGTFARAYAANRRAAIESIIEADPIATCVRTMMANRTMWTGSASDLLSLCAESARNEISTGGAWAKNPRALAGRLRRAQTFLRSLGIEITFSREGRTGTRINKVSTRAENCVSTNSIVSAARGNGSRGDQAMLADLRE